jgi:molybdopterin/thiamine biosynthesis adenylyltransferase
VSTADLRIPADLYNALLADVTQVTEWAGYLLCGVRRGSPDLLLGREWCPVPAGMQITGTGHGFSWHPDFDVQMLNRIQRENLAAVVIHYHGGSSPQLSRDDKATAQSLMPFLSGEACQRPHAFAVLGNRAIAGAVYRDGAPVGTVGTVRIAGSWLDDWTPPCADVPSLSGERQDRLTRGFGKDAYLRLRAAHVGIVGCGGGASHVIQQLAYLGVGEFTLVDADLVEVTNLNRLIGAMPARKRRTLTDRILRRGQGDVGKHKTEVMTRMVRSVDDTIAVTAIREFFPTTQTIEALRRCDVLVSCTDRLQVRDDLNRFAKRFLIPMVDIGIEITPRAGHTGSIEAISGRITKVLPDGPCLRCQGIVSDAKLEAERGGRPPGYTGAARIPDAAVVTLNGVIASMAATEVQQLITGFAGPSAPNCGWIYDGLTGTMEIVKKTYRGCAACRYERGLGDA